MIIKLGFYVICVFIGLFEGGFIFGVIFMVMYFYIMKEFSICLVGFWCILNVVCKCYDIVDFFW